MITIIGFNFASKTDRRLTGAEIPAARAAGEFIWVDCSGEPHADLAPLLASLGWSADTIAQTLDPSIEGYHPFSDALYVSFDEMDAADGLETRRLDVLIGERALATIHPVPSPILNRTFAEYREDFIKFSRSAGFLLYEIAAHLAEDYRGGLLRMSDSVERIQLDLFKQSDDTMFLRAADLTRRILALRKAMLSAREILRELSARQSPFVPESTRPSLDVMAGTIERLGQDLSTEREGLAETLNLYMGMTAHRTSQAMRKLTLISAIFLPLTFLCGVYGMNSAFIPEVKSPYFYPAFWLFCAGLSAFLIVLMRRIRLW